MIRENPTENSRVVYAIAPDETGIVYLGEVQGQWIFIEYERARGWVNRRFVQPIVSRGGRF